jgi:hypothetical protein
MLAVRAKPFAMLRSQNNYKRASQTKIWPINTKREKCKRHKKTRSRLSGDGSVTGSYK